MKMKVREAPSPLLHTFARLVPDVVYGREATGVGTTWGETWNTTPNHPKSTIEVIRVKVVLRSFGKTQLRYSLIGPWPQDRATFRIGRYSAEEAAAQGKIAVDSLILRAADAGLRHIMENHRLMEMFSG